MKPNDLIETLASCQESIQFATSPLRAFNLLALLQVAARHPDLPPYPAQVAREMIAHLTEEIVAATGEPMINDLIALGENDALDMTPEEFEAFMDRDILGNTPDETA